MGVGAPGVDESRSGELSGGDGSEDLVYDEVAGGADFGGRGGGRIGGANEPPHVKVFARESCSTLPLQR